jgi:hypothetical protein
VGLAAANPSALAELNRAASASACFLFWVAPLALQRSCLVLIVAAAGVSFSFALPAASRPKLQRSFAHALGLCSGKRKLILPAGFSRGDLGLLSGAQPVVDA